MENCQCCQESTKGKLLVMIETIKEGRSGGHLYLLTNLYALCLEINCVLYKCCLTKLYEVATGLKVR